MFGLGLGKLGLNGGGSRSLAAQIMAMSPKLWLEPSVSGGYQDSAGTTALYAPGVGSVDPPVGLALDKSQGLVLGPELVDSANTPAGWFNNVNNLVEQDGDAVKITYVDGGDPRMGLTAVYGLSQNLVVNKSYRVVFQVKVNQGAVNVSLSVGQTTVTSTTYVEITYVLVGPSSGTPSIAISSLGAGEIVWVLGISVRELPGNHASQATSTARPVLSARKNLLTYTEDFSNAAWTKQNISVTNNYAVAPDGQQTATRVLETAATALHGLSNGSLPGTGGKLCKNYCYVKSDGRDYCLLFGADRFGRYFHIPSDGTGSVLGEYSSGPTTGSIEYVGDGYYLCSISFTSLGNSSFELYTSDNGSRVIYAGDTSKGIICWHPHSSPASSSSGPYQRVTTASDYDASAAPLIHKFDGVDDVHNVTFPSSLGSACTVITANRYAAPTILTAQTIGTSLAINTSHAGKLVFDRALTAGETAVVTAWANKQGGL